MTTKAIESAVSAMDFVPSTNLVRAAAVTHACEIALLCRERHSGKTALHH